jgi:hypothetical protein
MNDALMDAAYALARQHYKSAVEAAFSGLDSQFVGTDFETIHHAAQRGMALHVAALEYARRVWARNLAYEKAEEILRTQFSDFPSETCQRAFGEAYVETR